MAQADIIAGNCGFTTQVETTMDGKVCKVRIRSDCAAIQRLAEELTDNPLFKCVKNWGLINLGMNVISSGLRECFMETLG